MSLVRGESKLRYEGPKTFFLRLGSPAFLRVCMTAPPRHPALSGGLDPLMLVPRISKPVVLRIKEEAMSLSKFALFSVAVAVSTLFVSFVAILLSYVGVSRPCCLMESYPY